MFCSNCGHEIMETGKFCSFCGTRIGESIQGKNDEEYVVKEGLCNRVKGPLLVQNGHGLLTNKRFIYSKHGLAKIAVIGVLANLTKGNYDFEIPIRDVVALKTGKQEISKTIILVTKAGEEFNFYFANRKKWLIEFNKLIDRTSYIS